VDMPCGIQTILKSIRIPFLNQLKSSRAWMPDNFED
jgi:hypothetical protein